MAIDELNKEGKRLALCISQQEEHILEKDLALSAKNDELESIRRLAEGEKTLMRETHSNEILGLQESSRDAHTTIEELKLQVSNLTSALCEESLERQLVLQESEKMQLSLTHEHSARVNTLQSNIEDLEQQLARVEDVQSATLDTINDLQGGIDALEKENQDKDACIQSRHEEVERLKKANFELERQITDISQKLVC